MKKSVTVTISEEKLSAVEMYLSQKNTSLETELTRYAEQLYLNVIFHAKYKNEKSRTKQGKSEQYQKKNGI